MYNNIERKCVDCIKQKPTVGRTTEVYRMTKSASMFMGSLTQSWWNGPEYAGRVDETV